MQQLSKSDYMLFLKHPAWLWLKKNDPKKLPPEDEQTKAKFEGGHEFEAIAEKIFKNSFKLSFSGYEEYIQLGLKTKEAIKSGHKTILQAKFEFENLACICDVVEFKDGNVIHLYEIKSSTKVKIDHHYDLAFQKQVIEKNGFTVQKIGLVHVNNRFIKKGEIDPKKITSVVDITDEVNDLQEVTEKYTQKAIQTMSQNICPDLSPSHCRLGSFEDWMKIYQYNINLDEDSIFNLTHIDAKLTKKFEDLGIKKLSEIDHNIIYNPKQFRQLSAYKTKKPIINLELIKQFLDNIKFPLYFLDYETLMSGVPYFDGTSPYTQIPFQFSLHKLDSFEGKLEEYSYLHDNKNDPTKNLSEKLIEYIGDEGTILTWNMSFEKKCNNLLAKLNPEYRTRLYKINDRIDDLMIPFSDGFYIDYRFHGSASIKKVLPVLVPELNHQDLEISDGGSAQRIWMDLIFRDKNVDKKEQILSNLLEYCALDTFAMVKIYQFLKNLIK